jgi:hypothetical protein
VRRRDVSFGTPRTLLAKTRSPPVKRISSRTSFNRAFATQVAYTHIYEYLEYYRINDYNCTVVPLIRVFWGVVPRSLVDGIKVQTCSLYLHGIAVADFPPRRPGFARGQVKWNLWWTKCHKGRFSPSTSVSLANYHSTKFSIVIITRGRYNRPIGGRRTEWTQLDSPPPNRITRLWYRRKYMPTKRWSPPVIILHCT